MADKNFFDQFDPPAQSGVIITKRVTPKDTAETISAQAKAAHAEATDSSEARIKNAQAVALERKNSDQAAEDALARMAPNSTKHGEAYFDAIHLPENDRVLARAYAKGDLGSRAGGITTSMLPIIQHAMNFDPTTSATNFPARVKMQQDLAGSQPNTAGGALRSMEQMLLHGQNVLKTGQEMDNFGPGLFGKMGNAARTGYLSHTDDPQVNTYNQEVKNYAPESQRAVAGTAGGIEERKDRAAGIAASGSQASRAGALQADARMAMERMSAVNDQYKRLMGKDITDQLSPTAKQAYDQIMTGGYDSSGKALYPAPGYTPGSILAGSSGGTTPPGGMPPSGGGGPTPPSGPTKSSAFYGGPGAAGGMALTQDRFSSVDDPTKRGAIRKLDAMLQNRSTPDSDIMAYAQSLDADPASVKANLDFRRNNPTYAGGYNADALGIKQEPLSTTRDDMNWAAQTRLGTLATNLGNAAVGGALPSIVGATGGNRALADAGLSEINRMNPKSAFAGNVLGGALGAGGIELGLGGAAAKAGIGASPWIARGADGLYGAISGASGAQDGQRGTGALLGAGAGVGGGMFGRGVTQMAGRAVRGVSDEAVQMLRDKGVPLTVGQALSQSGRAGSMVKGMEDRLTGVPILGDMVKARRTEGFTGFNQAAFNDGLAPIGQSTMGNIQEQGVDLARQARSKGYDAALDPVQLHPDAPFGVALGQTQRDLSRLPSDMQERGNYTMNRVGENFDPVNGLDGSGFQNSLRRIRQASSENAGQPNGQDLSEALGHTEDGLRGMVQRQAPGQLPMYDAANEANRNVSVLRDAVNAARSGTITGEPGVFSAAQLSNAAQSNARRYGDAHGTTNQPFFDLTRAGQKVLPSNVPDSGSAGRLAMFAIPSMLAGGGIGASNSDNAVSGGATGAGISTAAMAAILAAGGSKVGQHALTAALLDRPDIAVHLGNQIYNRGAPVAGMFGAGAAAAMLPGR